MPAQAAVFLWSALQARQRFFVDYGLTEYLADFLLNVGAILLATTLYSSAPIILNLLIISPALFLSLLRPKTTRQKRPHKPDLAKRSKHASMGGGADDLDPLPVRPFITAYRAAMMIITCLAILAVDFKIFPRRFAKVETWGTSLMDLGVGSFVFSAGVVSTRPILKGRLTSRAINLSSRLYSSAKHSLPLFALGFIRIYSVKGLEFPEHVTEYGTHWNFFFTLAFLPPSIALIDSLTVIMSSRALLSLLLGGVYQVFLETTRLKAFILTAPRTDLFNQNREGIFSYFGYLAIFLAGQDVGFFTLPREPNRNQLLLRLAGVSTIWILLFHLSTSFSYGLDLQVSRRLANLPYILWVAAFNCTQLTLFCLIESWSFPEVHRATNKSTEKDAVKLATSKIMRAFNRNGLAIFLLANPLTGMVNKTFNTLTMSRKGSMCVLLSYSILLTVLAVVLDRCNISIKL